MSRRKGFSLVELMMVLVVALIITAIGLPAVKRTITSYQLDSSGHAVASMLQNVRTAAVKGNTPYYAQPNAAGIPGVNASVVISTPAARFPAGYQPNIDPTVALAQNVTIAAVPGPNQAGLEAAAGITPGPMQVQVGGPIAFNSRGLPCIAPGGAWTCLTQPPVAFEWYMQNGLNGEWAAVTVTPTGRIRAWRGGANGNWQ